jgi:3-demethoxyubiquinol 3-hydroxylase
MTAVTVKPGDRRESVDQMIRVDQAGEYGATRIYAGQLAILGDRHPAARAISRSKKARWRSS